MRLTRRRLMIAGTALPLAAPMLGLGRAAYAQEPAIPAAAMPMSRNFALGDMSVTAILAGSMMAEDPHSIFGLNVDDETFAAASAENFIPADRTLFQFAPTVVRTGDATILFDTGLDPAGLLTALEGAGFSAADITHVVITHMHPDHIGGLADEAGAPTFPDASHVAGQVEFDAWAAMGDELFETKVRPLADRLTLIAGDDEVVPGVTAVEAFGHTPGHMAFRLGAGDQRILLTADTANHYVWSVGYPDWEVQFDMDKAMAAATRRRLLGMVAEERMAMLGYHLPFPGLGYLETRGDGFRWVPASYQFG